MTSHDVIHAGPKLIPSIFKISCHQQGCVGLKSEVLILTENEAEKDRWITTLKELQKATKQSPNQMVQFSVGSLVHTNRALFLITWHPWSGPNNKIMKLLLVVSYVTLFLPVKS